MSDQRTAAPDSVAQRLARLADDFEAQLGESATVEREGSESRTGGVTVTPQRPDALAVTWMDFGDALQIEAGHNGGRWELGRDSEDVDFLEDLARSVVAGRVVEVFGPSRSRVEVTLADGSHAVETGSSGLGGCLPRPGWPWRGRRVQYMPYR